MRGLGRPKTEGLTRSINAFGTLLDGCGGTEWGLGECRLLPHYMFHITNKETHFGTSFGKRLQIIPFSPMECVPSLALPLPAEKMVGVGARGV